MSQVNSQPPFPMRVKVKFAMIGFNLRRAPNLTESSVAWARPDVIWTVDREQTGFYHLSECDLWLAKGAVTQVT